MQFNDTGTEFSVRRGFVKFRADNFVIENVECFGRTFVVNEDQIME